MIDLAWLWAALLGLAIALLIWWTQRGGVTITCERQRMRKVVRLSDGTSYVASSESALCWYDVATGRRAVEWERAFSRAWDEYEMRERIEREGIQ
jgi:hypothetical protein